MSGPHPFTSARRGRGIVALIRCKCERALTYPHEMLITRPATDSDLAFIEEVFLRAMRADITASRGLWDEGSERKQFQEQLQIEHTWLIECGGIAVGFFMTVERGQDLELHTI